MYVSHLPASAINLRARCSIIPLGFTREEKRKWTSLISILENFYQTKNVHGKAK